MHTCIVVYAKGGGVTRVISCLSAFPARVVTSVLSAELGDVKIHLKACRKSIKCTHQNDVN